MKQALLIILLFCIVPFSTISAQTDLNLGDIAFCSYNADTAGNKEFGFVCFVDIEAGTEIKFTDNGWYAAGGFRANEGTLTLTTSAALSCGDQVFIDNVGINANNQDGIQIGTFVNVSLNPSTSGDQIFAYQGTVPTMGNECNFLAAIQMNGDWDADATSSNTSAQPSVFTGSISSIALAPEVDNGRYDCSTAGTDIASIRAAILDPANWTKSSSTTYPAFDCSFDCGSPTQIYDGTTDVCTATDVITSTGCGIWQDIMLNGAIVASINDNGEVLGAITTNVYLNSGTVRVNSDGIEYLDRSIYIDPATQPTSAVDVRFYFTATEIANLIAADADLSSINDLVFSKLSNATCDGSFVPGSGTTLVPPTSNMAFENGHYIEFSVTSFSGFFPHAGSVPLPIELIDFNLAGTADGILLNWETSSEINNDYFIIEHSTDGINFIEIGIVNGSGNSSTEQRYSHLHATASSGKNYYRLKQVDFNGSYEYSNIEVITIKSLLASIKIQPNPTQGDIRVSFREVINGNGRIEVYNTIGTSVASFAITEDSLQQELNLSHLADGVYIIHISNGKESYSERIIKK